MTVTFSPAPSATLSSCIASLTESHRTDEDRQASDVASDFAAALGQMSASELLAFEESDRQLQIATDAFALRHHAAESLVRLYHGLTLGMAAQGPIPCVWSAIAEGPTKNIDLVNEAKAHLLSPAGHENFWTMVFQVGS